MCVYMLECACVNENKCKCHIEITRACLSRARVCVCGCGVESRHDGDGGLLILVVACTLSDVNACEHGRTGLHDGRYHHHNNWLSRVVVWHRENTHSLTRMCVWCRTVAGDIYHGRTHVGHLCALTHTPTHIHAPQNPDRLSVRSHECLYFGC